MLTLLRLNKICELLFNAGCNWDEPNLRFCLSAYTTNTKHQDYIINRLRHKISR